MPVYKYRSIEDMPPVPPPASMPELLERIRRLWRRSSRLAPRNYPRGVFKYGSIEEAQAELERWQQQGESRSAPLRRDP